MKKKAKERPHYVNNKQFSGAVVDYVNSANEARSKKEEEPIITEYIGTCFLKIAEGLSHKPNFSGYTYREEMVMDAVENCLKAIENYNIEAATRTGKPNAFAYFTQISWYAFLRRIAKEKKQQDIKMKFIAQSTIEDFTDVEAGGVAENVGQHFVDTLKSRIDTIKVKDTEMKEIVKAERKKAKSRAVANSGDSDLSEILG